MRSCWPAPDTSLELRSLVEFQDFIIGIPGHPRGLGENHLLGVQRSLEASTDVHSIGLNIASDCRLSSERERTAGDVPFDRAFDRDVPNAHLRTIGTTTLRVRTWGYTGRDSNVAGTSLVSHKQKFGCRELSKTTSSCCDLAVEPNASAGGFERWAALGAVVLVGRQRLPAVRA